jgi:hypothetical protein
MGFVGRRSQLGVAKLLFRRPCVSLWDGCGLKSGIHRLTSLTVDEPDHRLQGTVRDEAPIAGSRVGSLGDSSVGGRALSSGSALEDDNARVH